MGVEQDRWIHTPPRKSATFDDHAIAEIRRAAASGIYDIRGAGAKRKLPHFDDLLFLGASISRYPLEGYRERCGTDVTLGTRFAKKPITLQIPITIAGMSFGSLSANAKEALGRGASLAGTSTTSTIAKCPRRIDMVESSRLAPSPASSRVVSAMMPGRSRPITVTASWTRPLVTGTPR